MTTAFSGMKVLDLAMGIAGPYAGMLCAQYGADVAKVEPPRGDWSRELGRQYGDLTAPSIVYNRGKRSVVVDMKNEKGREAVSAMADQADIIIESFRPGVVRRFGLDYASVRQRNPNVVYLSVSGFGQTGEMVHLPATDVVLQAFSGFMDLNKNPQGIPQRVDLVVMDIVTGLYAFQAIATGLLERERFGTGKYIDCSMLQSALAFQSPRVLEHEMEGSIELMYAPIGALPTRDGSLCIGVRYEHHFAALCRIVGRPDLATDPLYDTAAKRVRNEQALMAVLGEAFRTFTTGELVAALSREGILHAEVLSYPQVIRRPHVQATCAVSWVAQPGIEGTIPLANIPGAPTQASSAARHSPRKGEHSRTVLLDWGLPASVVDELIGGEIVQGRPKGR